VGKTLKIAIFSNTSFRYSLFLQEGGERYGRKAKVAFDALQVGSVIEGEEGHGGPGQWRPG